jgi:hypothetical protein
LDGVSKRNDGHANVTKSDVFSDVGSLAESPDYKTNSLAENSKNQQLCFCSITCFLPVYNVSIMIGIIISLLSWLLSVA